MDLTRRDFAKVAGFGMLAASLAASLPACASSKTGSSVAGSADASVTGSADEVVVVMGTTSEPEAGFDPLFAWGDGEHVHEPLIQSTLITTTADLGFENDLATGYSVSDDLLTWTFTIREDARFTDGDTLTAADVAFTINGIKANTASECDLSMVDEARAVDDVTVAIHLVEPCNALLYSLATIGIVPEHAYDAATYGTNPVGSGRYRLESWTRGQQAVFAANEDYYGDAPLMRRVIVLFMEEDAALASAGAGQADIVYTAATLAGTQVAGYELFTCKTVDCRGISLPAIAPGTERADGANIYPAGNAVTSSLAIRQAINYALDRDTMVGNVLSGHGTTCYSVCDSLPWATSDMQVRTDLGKAAALLADDGWTKGEDGVYARDGVRASIELLYPASDSVRQAFAAEFADQMAAFGIEVVMSGKSWDDIYPREYSDPVLWGWGANSPTQLESLIRSDSAGNYACYRDGVIDGHIADALSRPDVADSFSDWRKAQWDGTDGVAPLGAATWVWFANIDHLYFKRTGLVVADQKPHPHGHGWSLLNNVDRWSWA